MFDGARALIPELSRGFPCRPTRRAGDPATIPDPDFGRVRFGPAFLMPLALAAWLLLGLGLTACAGQGQGEGAISEGEEGALETPGVPPAEHDPAPVSVVGDVAITPIIHGTILLEHEGRAMYVDPWSRGDYHGLPSADLLLITHIHGDHFDLEAATLLMDRETVVVAPRAVADRWGGVDIVLANGEATEVAGIGIEAVPMYNLERGPGPGQLYHEKGRGNGYVLTLGDQRFYVSGDTECIPEMRELQEIDVAFVCMNLPYTMTPQEAAECVEAFRPRVVYPYHYRDSDPREFEAALADTPGVEVRIMDWYRPSPHE